MTTHVAVDAYREQIVRVADVVFSTMLLDRPVAVEEGWSDTADRLTAAVFFAGAWKGAVLVECDEELARHWTSQLLSLDGPPESDDDVLDTMGEIANMVGGNLKSVLPSGVGLSLPSVVRGHKYSIRVCGANPTCRQVFRIEHGAFRLTLVEVAL